MKKIEVGNTNIILSTGFRSSDRNLSSGSEKENTSHELKLNSDNRLDKALGNINITNSSERENKIINGDSKVEYKSKEDTSNFGC